MGIKQSFSTLLFVTLTISIVNAQFEEASIYMNDGTTLTGECRIPKMLDKNIVIKQHKNSSRIKLKKENIDSIVFTIDGESVKYVKEVTPRGYGNKKLNKTKSWLRVEISGFVSLYKGVETQMGSPGMNLWYCKKEDENNVYFITNKYSGAMVMTIGNKKLFKKFASEYFKDNSELVQKINTEYSNKDLSKVVNEYNDWITHQ